MAQEHLGQEFRQGSEGSSSLFPMPSGGQLAGEDTSCPCPGPWWSLGCLPVHLSVSLFHLACTSHTQGSCTYFQETGSTSRKQKLPDQVSLSIPNRHHVSLLLEEPQDQQKVQGWRHGLHLWIWGGGVTLQKSKWNSRYFYGHFWKAESANSSVLVPLLYITYSEDDCICPHCILHPALCREAGAGG